MNAKNIAVVLSANSSSLKSELAVASGAVKDFEKSVDSSSGTVSKAGEIAKVAGAAIAVGLAVAAAAAVSMAADFDKAMRNVNSISKLPEEQFKSLSAQVLELSKTVPQSATKLAEGLYDIASSGFQGAEGMTILTASAKAASAGLSDTQVAAQAIVGVINAYGLSAADATDVSDTLFQTVNVGVISFGELASQLGDVTGMAAAAHVSIAEVGAAIAAMTLAGIGGAEATTSLNRVIQSIIQPGDALANLIKNLGYESGYAMLQTLGLHGTMEKLRMVTGGNVEALMQLFPEIRSARGAFALMSADGQNYANTYDAITDATKRAGSTQAAFNEQMKSLSNQWELFKNNVSAAMITVGSIMIPYLVDGLNALHDFAGSVAKVAAEVGGKLGPFFEGIASAGADLVDLLTTLAKAASPLGKILAGIAAGAVITFLNTFAQLLSSTTGFLEDHKGVVIALAAVYAGSLVSSLIGAAASMGLVTKAMALWESFKAVDIIENITLRLSYLTQAIMGMGSTQAELGAVKTAFSGIGAAVFSTTTLVTVAIAVFAGLAMSVSNANSHAEALVKTLTSGIKTNDVDSYKDALDRLYKAQLASKDKADEYTGVLGALQRTYEDLNPFVENYGEDAYAANDKAYKSGVKTAEQLHNITTAAQAAASAVTYFATGVPDPDGSRFKAYAGALTEAQAAALKFADLKGIDLSLIDASDVEAQHTFNTAFSEWYDMQQNATPQQLALAGSFTTIADATSSATDKLKAYKDAMDALIGVHLNAWDAQTKFAGSIDSLTESLTKNGLSFDVNTKAGRDNRDSLSAAAQAALDHAVAVGDETGSIDQANGVLGEHIVQLLGVMKQSGMTDEEAQAYLHTLGLTPENVATLMQLHGVPEATAGLGAIKTGINEVKGDHYVSIYMQGASQAQIDLVNIQRAIAGIPANVDVQVRIHQGGAQRWGGIVNAHRWGGITKAAYSAYIATPEMGQLTTFNEPGTGGEAYIPRRGNKFMSLETLRKAAAWYGASVVADGESAAVWRPASASPSAPTPSTDNSSKGNETVNETINMQLDGKTLWSMQRQYERSRR